MRNYPKTVPDTIYSLILPMPVSKLENAEYQQYLIVNTGWAQHSVLIQKVKDMPTRYWYMQQTISNGWSFETLIEMINSNLHTRQGVLVNNFDRTVPRRDSELAKQLFKDQYIFDFIMFAAPEDPIILTV